MARGDFQRFSVEEASARQRENAKEFRKEYSRMRDVAEKRVKRLGEQFSQTKAYQNKQKGFKKLSEIDSRDLPKAFSEVSKFLGAKSSTVSGQKSIRNNTIKAWNEKGIPLNQQNYQTVMDIMDEMRKRKIVYGSDKVVEVADAILQVSNLPDDWIDHLEGLLEHSDELTEIPEAEGYDFDDMIELISGG